MEGYIDRADVRIARVGLFLPGGIGYHGEHLLFDDLWRIREVDGVIVTLTHLPAVCAEHLRRLGKKGLRLREGLAVEVVKAPDYLP